MDLYNCPFSSLALSLAPVTNFLLSAVAHTVTEEACIIIMIIIMVMIDQAVDGVGDVDSGGDVFYDDDGGGDGDVGVARLVALVGIGWHTKPTNTSWRCHFHQTLIAHTLILSRILIVMFYEIFDSFYAFFSRKDLYMS